LVLTGRPATPLYYIYTQIDPDFSHYFFNFEKYFHNVAKMRKIAVSVQLGKRSENLICGFFRGLHMRREGNLPGAGEILRPFAGLTVQ